MWIVLLVLGTLMSVQMAWAQQTPQKPKKPLTPQEIIESADKDKNGYVSRVEYLKKMSDGFFFLDANKDGFLSLDELQQSVQDIDRKRFTAADTNRDNKLSIHEYLKTLSQDFDTADINDDGVLDHNEMHQWLSHKK